MSQSGIKTSSTARFLDMPELLNDVFGLLDRRHNAVNSQVSKTWFELAIDRLWRDVDNLYRLFSILAPMTKSKKEPGYYEFLTRPSISQWRHFEKYSQHVHRIRYKGRQPRIAMSAFDAIARTRTHLTVFPALRTLEWYDDRSFELCVIFMHAGITEFWVRLYDNKTVKSARTALADIARMPNITHLSLLVAGPLEAVELVLVPLLSAMSKLEHLTILPYHFTPEIAQSVSRLQYLRIIEFEWDYNMENVHFPAVDTASSKSPAFATNSFSSLKRLSFCASFVDALHFVEAPNGPKDLEALTINSQSLESPRAYKILIDAISTTYDSLTSLGLSCHHTWSPGDPIPVEPQPIHESFTIDTFKPLFKYSRLSRLVIIYWDSLVLDEEDMKEIAIAFPLLETLHLNHKQMFSKAPNLTILSILPFAYHCPFLRDLGISVDTSRITMPESQAAFERTPRMRLRTLDLGSFTVGDEVTIAFLLSWICSPGCCLECYDGGERLQTQWRRVWDITQLFLAAHMGQKPIIVT